MKFTVRKSVKAQATLFIILAILILVSGIAIFTSMPKSRGPILQMPSVVSLPGTGEAANVRSFIQTCVDIISREAVDAFGMYGGEDDLKIFDQTIHMGDYTIPYYSAGGKNKLPDSQIIAKNILSTYVNNHLPECLLNFYEFPSVTVRGARISRTEEGVDQGGIDLSLLPPSPTRGNLIETQAQIGPDSVMFTVDYPVVVAIAGQETYLTDRYVTRSNARLGLMLDISRRIVQLSVIEPDLVDWPTIYDTNHAGVYNITYLLVTNEAEESAMEGGAAGAIVYQIIDRQTRAGQEPFTLRFATEVRK